MTTPLRFAAALAEGTGAASDSHHVPVEDVDLNHRDVMWAKRHNTELTGRTPTKLRKAIDDAAAEISASKNQSAAKPSTGAAKQSSDEAVLLKTAVVDSISQFEALLEDSAFRIRRAQTQCQDANVSIIAALKAFDNGFKYKAKVGFTISRLIGETGIATDLEFQGRYGSAIVVPDEQRYLSVLELLKKSPYVGREAEAMRARIQDNVTKPLLPLDDAGIPNLLLSINGFTTADALGLVRAKLALLHQASEELQAELDALIVKSNHARSNEDLATADMLENEILTVMQKLFDIHVQRLEIVGSSQTSSSSGMAAQIEAIMHSERVQRVETDTAELHRKATIDGETLEKDRTVRHRAHQNAMAAYQATAERSIERLQRNTYQQQQVWEEVQKGLARIGELRVEAEAEATEHLHLTEVEQKRRKEYSEYQESYAAHREYVRLVAENTEKATDFLQRLREHMEIARCTIRDMRIEEKIAALCSDERKHLDTQYTAFSGRTVRRLHGLEARATNASRQQRESEFQSRQAVQSDDAEVKSYVARFEALEKQAAQLKDRVRDTESQFDKNQSTYTNVMLNFEDFDIEHNPAIKALRLRVVLRDQYAAALDGLAAAHSTTTKELQTKIDELHQKSTASKLMEEKKRALRQSPKKVGA
jgi:hypothetical protein